MGDFAIILLAVVFRCLVSLWGYSGENTPPMYGDFEAQRHWMEITTSIPIGDWYRNTSENNLRYWGLDYPPLTAYVSWVFGKAAQYIHPPLVELLTSRGHESIEGKLFMRGSVILCDLIVFIPSIWFMSRLIQSSEKGLSSSNSVSLSFLRVACTISPSLLLIDNGHFQYNAVCIGLALLASAAILKNNFVLGSILFCLSLNFKQMALYYAPVFFFALLRTCAQGNIFIFVLHIIKLGIAVVASFALLWWPFCVYASPDETCVSSLLHGLSRLFPFARGLFEDKVANLWYCLSVVVDIRIIYPVEILAKISLLLTLLLLSPTAINLLLRPLTPHRLMLSLVNVSMAFFLASFQVHEKSLLLPLVPALLLLHSEPVIVGWFQILGAFTMFPLLIRDGLRIPYFALQFIYISFILLKNQVVRTKSKSQPAPDASAISSPGASKGRKQKADIGAPSTPAAHGRVSAATPATDRHKREVRLVPEDVRVARSADPAASVTLDIISTRVKWVIVVLSAIGMIALHVGEAFYQPPARYPDLFAALFSIYGAANLGLLFLLFNIWQWTLRDEQAESAPGTAVKSAKKTN